MDSTSSAGKLPWQVWASFGIMLFFAVIHILLALSKNIPVYYASFGLEVFFAIGLVKLWRWVYFATIAFSVLNIVMLIIAMADNIMAIHSLIISAAYLVLVVKTYMIVFRK